MIAAGRGLRADAVRDVPEQRRLHIVAALDARDGVRAQSLAQRFGVSVETIRRDLLVLERKGLVRRVHGGAVRAGSRTIEASFDARKVANLSAKRAMARLAVSLLEPGSTVIFDVGTSVTEIARALPRDFSCRVLTNSLVAAGELSRMPHVEVLAAGGRVRAGDLACSGQTTGDFFRGFFADQVFLGSGGVHPKAGLTDYHLDEIAVRKVMIQRSRESYVLADATKIGQIAVGAVCSVEQVSAVITDDRADPGVLAALRDCGVDVLVAPTEGDASVGAPAPAYFPKRRA
ncbi:MAG: DeoR/GlpR transcriptional regulator [Actinobacteria bacterium]|nr:DeoR/GlpR transcriptional regulator [Actinomycetota bacterium]